MINEPLPHTIHIIQAWTAQQPRGIALSPSEASASICAGLPSESARTGLGRTVIADLLIEHAGWQRSGRLLFLPPGVRKPLPDVAPVTMSDDPAMTPDEMAEFRKCLKPAPPALPGELI
jgi:hypothetical protein